jgi:hypothetical protein
MQTHTPIGKRKPRARSIVSRIVHINECQFTRLAYGGHQTGLIVQTQIVTKPVDRAGHGLAGARRHRSEQYFTVSQFFAHDLRQTISRLQCAQSLRGNAALLPRKLSLVNDLVNVGLPLPRRAAL